MIKQLISTYLDTTPRQWLVFWAETVNFDYKNPKRQIREIAISFYAVKGVAFAGSLTLHLLLLFYSIQSQKMFDSKQASAYSEEITLQDKKVLAALLAQQELMEVTGVYYLDGASKKKKMSPPLDSVLSNLLKKLSSGKNKWAIANKIAVPHAAASVSAKKTKSDAFSWQQAVERSDLSKETSKNIEMELTEQIAKYDVQFQSCYEKALLKDSSMNGKIEFLMQVGNSNNIAESTVRFEGVGLPAGKSQLEGCLRGVASRIRINDKSQDLAGKKIKFYAMLKAW